MFFNYNVNRLMFDDHDTYDTLSKQYIAELVNVYDKNRYFLDKTFSELKDNLEVIQDVNNSSNKELHLLLDYYATMAIRLLSTLDDVIIRLSCFTLMTELKEENINKIGFMFNGSYLDSNNELKNDRRKLIQKNREYFEQQVSFSSNKNKYPSMPGVNNRVTKVIRHKITHEGYSFFQEGSIDIGGLILGVTNEKLNEHNISTLKNIYIDIASDIARIDYDQKKLQSLINEFTTFTYII